VCRLVTTNHSNYQKSRSTHGIQLARSHFPWVQIKETDLPSVMWNLWASSKVTW
jgi:hypothetical protein